MTPEPDSSDLTAAASLAEGALLIARDEYPDLDVLHYLQRLDAMASAIKQQLAPSADPVEVIEAINHSLFAELGFAGNIEKYDDPRNSFLNDVLDRRLGIPITLSVIYIEIGERLGLALRGVSFPAISW